MSSLCERRALLALLAEACDAGARLRVACAQIGLSERTVHPSSTPKRDFSVILDVKFH